MILRAQKEISPMDDMDDSASGLPPFCLLPYSPSTPSALCHPAQVLVAREGYHYVYSDKKNKQMTRGICCNTLAGGSTLPQGKCGESLPTGVFL
jgi:hypothetical protein